MLPLRSAAHPNDAMPPLQGGTAAFPAEPADALRAVPTPPDARLSAADYERWLLPPVPRDGLETLVHRLSLAAGLIAFTGGAGLLWMLL